VKQEEKTKFFSPPLSFWANFGWGQNLPIKKVFKYYIKKRIFLYKSKTKALFAMATLDMSL